jgi:N-methylhydantoinase B
MVSKMVGIHITEGQKVRLETPGGGGYGEPATRDPEAVARDVRLGYVTAERAISDYHAAVTEDGRVEQVATARLRNREAAE